MDVYNKREQKDYRVSLRKDSPKAERILWSRLKGKQVSGFKFRRQFGIDKYIVDFYCAELKLVIEVDGDTHFMGDGKEKDKARQHKIESYGMTFFRVTNNDVYKNLDGVLMTLWKVIEDLVKKQSA
ncbi:MAG: endonuclease domain-containing protein [Nitrospinae bacterium]|nr:endonuclease domain-containing protein [Nitrospinota bacterium]